MAAPRILRKFPLNFNIGTDICHVARMRHILSTPGSLGPRFVRKILNTDERTHPKIQWLCESESIVTRESNRGKSEAKSGAEVEAHTPAPGAQIQVAAQFMAGRCVLSSPQ